MIINKAKPVLGRISLVLFWVTLAEGLDYWCFESLDSISTRILVCQAA